MIATLDRGQYEVPTSPTAVIGAPGVSIHTVVDRAQALADVYADHARRTAEPRQLIAAAWQLKAELDAHLTDLLCCEACGELECAGPEDCAEQMADAARLDEDPDSGHTLGLEPRGL